MREQGTVLLPTAEHILELGVRRAGEMIREGRGEEARRAMMVATAAAELIQLDADELERQMDLEADNVAEVLVQFGMDPRQAYGD